MISNKGINNNKKATLVFWIILLWGKNQGSTFKWCHRKKKKAHVENTGQVMRKHAGAPMKAQETQIPSSQWHSVNKIHSKEIAGCFWAQGSLDLRNTPTQGLASNSLIFLSWSPLMRPRAGICESHLSTPDFPGRKKQLLPSLTHSSDVDELISLPLL